eukprot:gene7092-11255_t
MSTDQELMSCVRNMYSEDSVVQYQAVSKFRNLVSVSQNPPIKLAIELGGIPLLVKLLNNDDSKIQFEAAWALTNVSSGDSEDVECVFNSGAISSLIRIISSSNVSFLVEQCTWCLGNMAGDSNKYRDALIQANLLDPLIKLLSSTKTGILRNSIWSISNLLRGSPSPSFEDVKVTIAPLSKFLYSNDDYILCDVMWSFSYLSNGSDEKIHEIYQCKVIKQIIKLLGSRNDNVVLPGLRTIGNLVSGKDCFVTDEVLKFGGLDAIAKLLPNKLFKKEAIWFFSNISAGNTQQIDHMISSGIFVILMSMIPKETIDVVTEISWTISNPVLNADEKQINYLISNGLLDSFVSIIVRFHKMDDKKVLDPIFEALEILFEKNEKYCKNFEEIDEGKFLKNFLKGMKSKIKK